MQASGWTVSLALFFALLFVSAPGGAAEAVAVDAAAGAYTYKEHCTGCHGASGAGDGPMADNLRFRPPDLRRIAKRNGGQFPAQKVYRIVDGRVPVKGHGGSDMPVWGDALRNADSGYDQRIVELRLRAVVEYLRTLQTP